MTIDPINDPVVMSCPIEINFAYEDIPIDFNWTVDDPDVEELNDGFGFLWISIESENGTFYFDITETPHFIQYEGLRHIEEFLIYYLFRVPCALQC